MRQAAFIGVGNMGSALARAACRAVGPDQVVVTNRTPAKAQKLAQELGCLAVATNLQAVEEARCIFLCVKPQLMAGVLAELSPVLEGQDKVLISVAAGLTLDTLRGFLSPQAVSTPLVRIMPNTCVEIGQGMLALAAPSQTEEKDVAQVKAILAQAGQVDQVSEALMDPFTAVAGCGPAFVYPFIEALADGGVMAGLPRQQAMVYAAQTVLGAAAMVLESGLHPGQLKDAVCSPGGSTIAGVAALERNGFRATAMEAVLAAWQRNKELGKQ